MNSSETGSSRPVRYKTQVAFSANHRMPGRQTVMANHQVDEKPDVFDACLNRHNVKHSSVCVPPHDVRNLLNLRIRQRRPCRLSTNVSISLSLSQSRPFTYRFFGQSSQTKQIYPYANRAGMSGNLNFPSF
jgi:hypothetical protein